MSDSPKTSPADRSHSGPPGAGFRQALGLEDPDLLLDQVQQVTRQAIAVEGLTDLCPVDRGGYGIVLRGKDAATGNLRAVKVVLQPEQEHRLQIFRRECRILDAKELPTGVAPRFYAAREPAGGQPFLIQEWIEGQKLGDWLDAHVSLKMPARESLCRAIFATYARLHAANLIHRDVSLGNIMIAGKTVRLIDFGGAGRAAPGYISQNTQSRVPTTEAFVSGPVLRSERKPCMADEVHAVAKICFTVLTGQLACTLTTAQRRAAMKQAGCASDIIAILIPRMEDPPQTIALQSQILEFEHG